MDDIKFNKGLWGGSYQGKGSNYVICDICGFKVRASSTKYNHDGLLVCAKTCYEPRHPQETIRGVKEKITPDKVRVEGEDTYLWRSKEFYITTDGTPYRVADGSFYVIAGSQVGSKVLPEDL
jgi:hypothetical protein